MKQLRGEGLPSHLHERTEQDQEIAGMRSLREKQDYPEDIQADLDAALRADRFYECLWKSVRCCYPQNIYNWKASRSRQSVAAKRKVIFYG